MGVVSGAVLEAGGTVTGVIPYAMVVSGGEKEQTAGQALSKAAAETLFDGQNRQNVCQGLSLQNHAPLTLYSRKRRCVLPSAASSTRQCV